MIISTITEAIGSTPLYRFDNQHYSMPKGSAIYAKLEYLNPEEVSKIDWAVI